MESDPARASARSVNAVLDRAVARWPSQTAVITDRAQLTYEELGDRVERLAGGLAEAGLCPGDRIAACLPNGVDIVIAFYAAARIGAIWVGVNRTLAPTEQERLLAETTPKILLTTADSLSPATVPGSNPGFEAVAVDAGDRWSQLCSAKPVAHDPVDPLVPAAIAYTSGTSGTPKGIVHSQHNLVLPGEVLAATRGYDSGLRRGDCLPLTILNLIVLSTLTAAQVGGTSVLRDRTDAASLAGWIRRHDVNVFSNVPTILYDLVRSEAVDPSDLSSLRDVWTGGASCPQEMRDRFLERFGRPVHATYGLTEAPSVVAIDTLDDPSPSGVSGRPLPHLDVTIERLGTEPAEGEHGSGEIVVGPAAAGRWAGAWKPFLGYWNRPLADIPVAAGRLRTGDIGRFEDGRLAVVDRLGAVIIRGGANVYPTEVEHVLRSIPGVADAVVVGLPDERLGETVNALVVLETDRTATESALVEGCREELARYKTPERILIVDELERNALGKPDLTAARARLAADLEQT